jgi:Sec-independent protein secretion pathway component TatC
VKSAIGTRLSTLWVVVMFNMIFADILSFMVPGELQKVMAGNTSVHLTQGLLLVFAVLLEIPIVMIFLSRILRRTANRIVNVIACVITIAFVIAGGSMYLHYIFFAAVEGVCMIFIAWSAIRWPKPSED